MSDPDFSRRARSAHAFGHTVLRERPGCDAFNAALLRNREASPAEAPPPGVLVVEDDTNDALLTERALRDVLGPVQVTLARTTAEARARISRGEIRPGFVLLGVEPRLGDVPGFLRWLGDGSGLPAMPIVLLLSVDFSPQELLGGSAGGCSRLVRPLGFDALVRALHRIVGPRSQAARIE